MVLGFLKAVQQMAAAALAGNLRNLLFGTPTANNEHGGGFLGTLLNWGISAVGAAFGGHFSSPAGGAGVQTGPVVGGVHLPLGIPTGGHARGGLMKGRGTGTSDSNLSWLSNGEFVNTADTVAYYGPDFFQDLEERRIGRFAEGGLNYNRGSSMDIYRTSGGGSNSYRGGDTHINLHNHFPAQKRGRAFGPSPEQMARKTTGALQYAMARDGRV